MRSEKIVGRGFHRKSESGMMSLQAGETTCEGLSALHRGFYFTFDLFTHRPIPPSDGSLGPVHPTGPLFFGRFPPTIAKERLAASSGYGLTILK